MLGNQLNSDQSHTLKVHDMVTEHKLYNFILPWSKTALLSNLFHARYCNTELPAKKGIQDSNSMSQSTSDLIYMC